ncbi:hypothetical protein [Streptomyces sp. NPDC058861]|uniref:hypothetical protein n=1 Tax=Streptomyces sp. NPDC058861 TaxID=3346653 RepID=UPI003696DF1F
MRSRTVTGVVLLASGLMGIGMGTAHADTEAPSGAATWGSTFQAQSSSGSTSTYDNEVHSGTASNFGQEITNYASTGTDYANQAATSHTVGGSQTQYSSATNTPAYDSWGSHDPGSSGQSQTVGGSVTNFANSANSGSNVVGGFVTQGVTGSQYTNDQYSIGGSSTQSSPGSTW